ncbi:MAG: hypothetical protein ACLSSW_05330 [Acutalibacteraceae bacterium]|jgi:hypothetical protein
MLNSLVLHLEESKEAVAIKEVINSSVSTVIVNFILQIWILGQRFLR